MSPDGIYQCKYHHEKFQCNSSLTGICESLNLLPFASLGQCSLWDLACEGQNVFQNSGISVKFSLSSILVNKTSKGIFKKSKHQYSF